MNTPYRKDDSKELVLRDMPEPPVYQDATSLQRIWAGADVGELFVIVASYVVVGLPLFIWPSVSAVIYFCFFGLWMGGWFLDSLERNGRDHFDALCEEKLGDWWEKVEEWQEERIEQIKSAGYEVFTDYKTVNIKRGSFLCNDEIEFEVPKPKELS